MALERAIAWVMLAVLIAWLGIVLAATFDQLDREIRAAREREE